MESERDTTTKKFPHKRVKYSTTTIFSYDSTIYSYTVDIGMLLMSSALRIQMLDVPLTSVVGESIELTCSYDLEGDKLYSVKWYKNDAEVGFIIVSSNHV